MKLHALDSAHAKRRERPFLSLANARSTEARPRSAPKPSYTPRVIEG
jgi:hypothetical protein